ncbi:hypothetical protein CYMTET_23957, partial [Cymbomonas tetramitiformis]
MDGEMHVAHRKAYPKSLHAGDCFGVMALLRGCNFGSTKGAQDDPGIRAASTLCYEPVVLLRLGKAAYSSTLRRVQQEELNSHIAFLRRTNLLNDMLDDDLLRLHYFISIQTYPRNEAIVMQGDRVTALYIIRSGQVKLQCLPSHLDAAPVKQPIVSPSVAHGTPRGKKGVEHRGERFGEDADGGAKGASWTLPLRRTMINSPSAVELGLVGPTDIIGETLFTPASVHTYSAITTQKTEVLVLSAENIDQLPKVTQQRLEAMAAERCQFHEARHRSNDATRSRFAGSQEHSSRALPSPRSHLLIAARTAAKAIPTPPALAAANCGAYTDKHITDLAKQADDELSPER